MVSNSQTSSFIQRTLNALHRCVCHIVRFVMIKLYGKHGETVPPIDDRLLLESATSIAEKIRTKEVSVILRSKQDHMIKRTTNANTH